VNEDMRKLIAYRLDQAAVAKAEAFLEHTRQVLADIEL